MDNELFEQRKRMIYDFICDELYVPMKLKELAILMQVPKRDRAELTRVMDALVEDGKVELTKKGKYIKSEKKYETGVFTSHPKGFGFVTIEGMDEDIFIPAEQVNGAMHMDTVQLVISPTTGGKRREGTITKILSHGMNEVVGTYEDNKTFGFVVPDNPKIAKDIFIPKERSMGAVTGHKVIVAITDYGKDGKKPEGKVTEIIGHINDPGVDIMSLVKAYNIPVEFSPKIMRQVENVSNEVSEADMAGRLDLRDWQMVTIDGEDAKDLDDAVSLTKEGDLYCLGVHIADVSNYVQEHSALDVEAEDPGGAGTVLVGEAVDLGGDQNAPLLGEEGDQPGEGGARCSGNVGDGGGGLGVVLHGNHLIEKSVGREEKALLQGVPPSADGGIK